jgi:hypothetical protein
LLKEPNRVEIYNLVIQGRDKPLIAQLDVAINLLKEIQKELLEKEKQEQEALKAASEKTKQKKEEARKADAAKAEQQAKDAAAAAEKEKATNKEVLQARASAEQTLRAEEKDRPEDKDRVEEKDRHEDKARHEEKDRPSDKDKDKDKTLKKQKKGLSLYERFFGKTDESVLKKGSYVPPDKKMIQIAEQELTEYKAVRDKLTSQLTKDKMMKGDQIRSIKQQVSDKLKQLEYGERSEKDKLSAEYRNLLHLKEELEKSGEKQLQLSQEYRQRLESKRKQDLDELNKLYTKYVDKIQFHRGRDKSRYLLELIDQYDGSSGSMLELKRRLHDLVEVPVSDRMRHQLTHRKREKGKERKKGSRGDRGRRKSHRKLRRPGRGVEAVKELLLLP